MTIFIHQLGLIVVVSCCIIAQGSSVDIIYGSIGDSVILPCSLEYSVSNINKFRWRRGIIIASGSNINAEFVGHERFQLNLQSVHGKYNLQLLNVTDKDFGEYACEQQLDGGVEKTRVFLRDQETDNKTIIIITEENRDTTTLSHEEPTTLSDKIIPKSTTTENNHVTESTLPSFNNNEKEIVVTSTGLSSREIFYYTLLAAGLALVLFLSIGCNFLLNRKCKDQTLRSKDSKRSDNTKLIDLSKVIENVQEEDNNEKMGSTHSVYETINEHEMLRVSVINNHNVQLVNKNSNRALPAITKTYYDEIDDKINPEENGNKIKHCLQIGTAKLRKYGSESQLFSDLTNTAVIQNKINKPKYKSVSQILNIATNGIVSNSSAGSSNDDIASCDENDISTQDEYLNPYVPLKTNEMEYAHSYCSPVEHDVEANVKTKANSLGKNVKICVPSSQNYLNQENELSNSYEKLRPSKIEITQNYCQLSIPSEKQYMYESLLEKDITNPHNYSIPDTIVNINGSKTDYEKSIAKDRTKCNTYCTPEKHNNNHLQVSKCTSRTNHNTSDGITEDYIDGISPHSSVNNLDKCGLKT